MTSANRNLSIRLAVIDGEKARRELTLTGEQGQRAMQRIKEATAPASRALVALDFAGGQARLGMERLAGNAGNLGFGLARMGIAGLAAAAAIGTVTLAVVKGAEAFRESEQSASRLAAALRATESAAGVTERQIASLAGELQKTTLFSDEEVQDAATSLIYFRNITGESFTRAIAVSLDLAQAWGSDVATAAQQLGRVLQDPEEGLGRLEKAVGELSFEEKEMIRQFVAANDLAAAQGVILDKLTASVGGQAAGQNKGLTGATNALADAWDELLEGIGRTVSQSETAIGGIHLLTRALEGLRAAIDPSREQRKSQLEAEIAELQNSFGTRLNQAVLGTAPILESKKRELKTLNTALAGEQKKADAENETARQAAATAAARRNRDALLSIEREFENKTLEQTRTRRDKLTIEAEQAKARIDALFRDGKNPDEATRARAAVDGNLRAGLAKLDQEAAKPTLQLAAANRSLITELEKRLNAERLSGREGSIQTELNRLNATATVEQTAQVRELAGALYDLRAAEKAATEARRAAERIEQEAARQREDAIRDISDKLLGTMPAYESAMVAAEEWRERTLQALSSSASDYETYRDQVEAVYDDLREKALDQSTNLEDGLTRAIRKYGEDAADAGAAAERVFNSAAQGIEETLTDAFTNASFSMKSFGDLAGQIAKQVLQEYIRAQIVSPLVSGIGGLFSGGGGASLLASIFHAGGEVGETSAPTRSMPAALYHHAPRLHNGLMPDEFPAILQKGETVIPKNTTPTAQAQPVEVKVINVTDPDMIRSMIAESMSGGRTRQIIVNSVLQAMDQRGLQVRT
ncbi:MAG: phage tail length tape measure family protein [Alphaproteobacteria bacterium]